MPTLDFNGKQFIRGHHLTVPIKTLEIDEEKSFTGESAPSLDDNLIIHGDNLEALKALLPRFANSIKCIYIDPPYNTGNEGWVYNDNVNSPQIKAWLNKNVVVEDLERHDKWLCMMWPRLNLLKELLSDDGIIFISIDDNEVHNLLLLLNEIFDESNFIACLPTVMNLKGNNDEFGFAGTHEYTLCWAKDKKLSKIGEFDVDEEAILDLWIEDDYGYYKKGASLKSTGQNAPRSKRPNLFYPIFVDTNNELTVTNDSRSEHYEEILPITDGKEMSWRWGKQKVSNESYDILVERSDSGISLYKKQRPKLTDLPTKKPKSLLYKPSYSSGNGTTILKQIFGNRDVFKNPKPVQLLKDLIYLSTEKEDIILDSFAGSGTTAHAVLALNKEDSGNRKFILVECKEYANDITAERVRRVIKGVENANDPNLKGGLDGSFTYCTLGDTIGEIRILTDEPLPDYETVANYIAFVATGKREFTPIKKRNDYCFGETENILFYLIYEPELVFMQSRESALNYELARKIEDACKNANKKAYIYASHKIISQKDLTDMQITFCQLPYNIYRIKE